MPCRIRSICAWRTVRGPLNPLSLPEYSLSVTGLARAPNSLYRPRELFSINRMTPGEPDRENLPPDPASLLPLALSKPQDALLAARSVLDGGPMAYDASLARHAIGIVLRDRGDLPGAIAELRSAVKLARASGKLEREVDVQPPPGVTLAWAGHSRRGLAVLDQAVAASRGVDAGRVFMRRASVL